MTKLEIPLWTCHCSYWESGSSHWLFSSFSDLCEICPRLLVSMGLWSYPLSFTNPAHTHTHKQTTLAVLSAANLEAKQWVSVVTAVC